MVFRPWIAAPEFPGDGHGAQILRALGTTRDCCVGSA